MDIFFDKGLDLSLGQDIGEYVERIDDVSAFVVEELLYDFFLLIDI